MTTLIQCKVNPWTVPHFGDDCEALLTAMPTRFDFMLADYNGDNVIDEEDVRFWHNSGAMLARQDELLFVDPQNYGIWAEFDSDQRIFAFGVDETLFFQMPPEFMSIMVNLRGLEDQWLDADSTFEELRPGMVEQLERYSDTVNVFKLSELYENLRNRLDYLERTYIRM